MANKANKYLKIVFLSSILLGLIPLISQTTYTQIECRNVESDSIMGLIIFGFGCIWLISLLVNLLVALLKREYFVGIASILWLFIIVFLFIYLPKAVTSYRDINRDKEFIANVNDYDSIAKLINNGIISRYDNGSVILPPKYQAFSKCNGMAYVSEYENETRILFLYGKNWDEYDGYMTIIKNINQVNWDKPSGVYEFIFINENQCVKITDNWYKCNFLV
jgi:hypothetical protein